MLSYSFTKRQISRKVWFSVGKRSIYTFNREIILIGMSRVDEKPQNRLVWLFSVNNIDENMWWTLGYYVLHTNGWMQMMQLFMELLQDEI